MKLATLALFFASLDCFGQGQVTFLNDTQTLISTNAVHGGPATGPTAPYPGTGSPQFIYALFAAPSTVTTVSGVTDANWTFTGAYATNTTGATGGRLAGGAPVLPSPYAAGTTWSFLVRGWSSTIAGEDWSTVQAFMSNIESNPSAYGAQGQFFGTSSVATLVAGSPPLPIPHLFGTTPGSLIQGFLLDQVPIPEPSVSSIFAMGFAALLSHRIRYRKRRP